MELIMEWLPIIVSFLAGGAGSTALFRALPDRYLKFLLKTRSAIYAIDRVTDKITEEMRKIEPDKEESK